MSGNMHLLHSLLWLSAVALVVHGYSYISLQNGNGHGRENTENLHTYNSKNNDIPSSSKTNENSQSLQNGKQSNSPNIPSPTTNSASDGKSPQSGQQAAAVFQDICRKLCSHGTACPPECSEVYLDPWTFFAASPPSSRTLKSKRRVGLDGLTFEDYLFMRWLGRDISRRGLH